VRMQYQSFGEQVSAAGLTKKDILREGKRTVRQLCIQTGTPLKVPLSLINQYSLRPVYERLVELIARQFPNSNAIAPLPPPGRLGKDSLNHFHHVTLHA